jgi:hypothetical protein
MSSRGGSGRRCEAHRADGERCRAWAVRSSDAPRCAAHLGLTGAPPGNRNAERHGAYSQPLDEIRNITDAVEDMQRRLTRIGHYLDDDELEAGEMLSALGLYGMMVSRYGRLLRDQRALSDEAIDSFLALVARAIDEVKTQMGYPVELGSSEEG